MFRSFVDDRKVVLRAFVEQRPVILMEHFGFVLEDSELLIGQSDAKHFRQPYER